MRTIEMMEDAMIALRWLITTALAAVFFCSIAALAAEPGFHDESELGIVIAGGNSRATTFNAKQKNTWGQDIHLVRFDGALLRTTSQGVEKARSWSLGLRYEIGLSERLSAFAAQNIESDIFAGFLQRYNSDLGAKYQLMKSDNFSWTTEGGYRYTVENLLSGDTSLKKHFARIATTANRSFNKSVSALATVEFLPQVKDISDYRLNSELSLSALLNEVFSVKSGYTVRYTNQPLPGVAYKTDTIFTTSLVAKF